MAWGWADTQGCSGSALDKRELSRLHETVDSCSVRLLRLLCGGRTGTEAP
jgi:hypothetical protein